MDAQSYTAQERRAANQVWAAAGAYGFEPLFLARYTDGTTDFYMNTVVGLIHKYYGDALIQIISLPSSTSSPVRSGWQKISWSTPCRPHAGGVYWAAPTR